ncbi:RabGAP/TBC [Xylariomycetidae sp. FL0641]|nr:RabGAP/TBC [Xylariomycetidae sp. FL0641]
MAVSQDSPSGPMAYPNMQLHGQQHHRLPAYAHHQVSEPDSRPGSSASGSLNAHAHAHAVAHDPYNHPAGPTPNTTFTAYSPYTAYSPTSTQFARLRSASPGIASAPISPVSPRWDSLPPGRSPGPNLIPTSTPSSPVRVRHPHDSARSIQDAPWNSESSGYQSRGGSTTPSVISQNTNDSAVYVGNFSRPGIPGAKPPQYDSLRVGPPSPHQPEPSLGDMVNDYPQTWPRPRGPSISSNRSAATFASLPVRPPPDLHVRDSPRSRGRQAHPPVTRVPLTYGRAESNGPNSRDYLPRMASMPTDELRNSYRSQVSESTGQNTTVTERSSIVTKRSSIVSVYENVDEDLSVEDVMGMYEKGFGDDSGAEDIEDNDQRAPSSPMSLRAPGTPDSLPRPQTSAPLRRPQPSATFPGPMPMARESTSILEPPSVITYTPEPEQEIRASEETTRTVEADESDEEKADFEAPPRPTRQATNMTSMTNMTNMTTVNVDDRDRYGFRKSNQYITREQFDDWNKGYTEYLARRRKKWHLFLKENGLMTDTPNRFPPRSNKAKRFVRKGIPPEWRGAAWFYYAGGPAILAKHAGTYDQLLKQKAKDVDIEAIERDLHRTFPDNINFRSVHRAADANSHAVNRHSQQTLRDAADLSRNPVESSMISSLRRVLRAFSLYNPRIGYCQSLNFLAGLLLLFVESEEHAFWLLNIITRVYLPGTHEMSLEGANVDLGVLMSSLRETMPHVWAKIGGELDGTDAARPKGRRGKYRGEPARLPPITLCMTAWFMSCFIGTLPIETTLRVWDVFFYEGSKTLFRIALAIFKVGEPEIRGVADPMEIFQVVQTIPRRLLNANALIEACFKRRNGFGHLSQETVEQKRQERRAHVKEEREKVANGTNVVTVSAEGKRKGSMFNRRR